MGPRWSGIAVSVKRFRQLKRRKGLRRLRHDVRSCEYEDVRVMWEILNGKEEDSSASLSHSMERDSLFCSFVAWVRRVPDFYVAGSDDHNKPV